MSTSLPAYFTLHLPTRESLSGVEKTVVLDAYYIAMGTTVHINHETQAWSATTRKSDGKGGLLVAVAFPMVRLPDSLLHHVANKCASHLSKVLDPGVDRYKGDDVPQDNTGWERVDFFKLHIVNANIECEPYTMMDFLEDRSVAKSSEGLYRVRGRMSEYAIWDPETYDKRPVIGAVTPGKISPTAARMAIEVEKDSSIPQASFEGVDPRKSHTNDHEGVFYDLVARLRAIDTKNPDVWLDVARAGAGYSIAKETLLSLLEDIVDERFTVKQRVTLGLCRADLTETVDVSHPRREPSRVTGNETLMEYLWRIDRAGYWKWCNPWWNEVLDLLFTGGIAYMPGMARFAARYLRGRVVPDPTSANQASWYVYDEECSVWRRHSTIPIDLLQELGGLIECKIAAAKDDPVYCELFREHGAKCRAIIDEPSKRTQMCRELAVLLVPTRKFSEMRDRIYSIFPLSNACVEIVKTEAARRVSLRPHKKQDYTTAVVPIDLNLSKYSWEHPDVRTVMDFFKQFVADEASREYLLYWCGSTMWRVSRDRCVLQLIGGGGNAKTTFVSILEVLGHRMVARLKASLFYAAEKRVGAADTELAAIEGAAIAIVEEIEPGKTGRASIVKGLSGGGRLPIRNIYEPERVVPATVKLVFVGNDPLRWPSDQAMKDRIVHILCEARFSDSAPPTLEEQLREQHYPKDPDFAARIPQLADAIIWIFYQYLVKYVELGRLPYAEKIDMDTRRYWAETDIYHAFFVRYYRESTDPCDCIIENDIIVTADAYFQRHPAKREYKAAHLIECVRTLVGPYKDETKRGWLPGGKIVGWMRIVGE